MEVSGEPHVPVALFQGKESLMYWLDRGWVVPRVSLGYVAKLTLPLLLYKVFKTPGHFPWLAVWKGFMFTIHRGEYYYFLATNNKKRRTLKRGFRAFFGSCPLRQYFSSGSPRTAGSPQVLPKGSGSWVYSTLLFIYLFLSAVLL
jgi:hypothetical protein